ncbi:hypothetical protein BH10BAC6_BH10BAC6_17200 [soil metagenome]
MTSDVNYRRYKLDPDTAITYPVKVLDSAEPRNRLYNTTAVDWNTPLDTEFPPADSGDCRRLQLVINLRRVSAVDTASDTAAVVSVVVQYQLRWKDHVDTNRTVDSIRYRMPFRRVPNVIAGAHQLPNSRGTEMHMRDVDTNEYVDSIVIRRSMLPLHSNANGPDITIVAEFRTDTIFGIEIVDTDTTFHIRRPHILKSSAFDFPSRNADTLTLADTNMRYMAIDTLGVTVWYHGNSSVAIRSISLVTPQTKHATSGYRDAHWASKMKDHVATMKSKLSAYHDSTGRTYKVLGFYMCDEFRIEHLLGMRYRLQLLDRRLTSEAGFGGPLFTGDNEHGEYGHQKLQGFPTKFPWMAGMSQPGFQDAAPYFAFGHQGNPDTSNPMPTPSMGLKNGYIRDAVVSNPLLSEAMVKTNFARSGYGTYGLPLDSAYRTGVAYQEFINSDRGPAAWFENIAFVMMYQTGDMFFAKRRDWWANFFYHMTPHYKVDANGRPYFEHTDKVPQTGEWVRLEHGSSLAMGCRGFMYDKWRYGYEKPPSTDSFDVLAFKGRQVFPTSDTSITNHTLHRSDAFLPGYICADSVAMAWDLDATVSVDSLIQSNHLGSDYLTDDDAYRIQSYNNLDTMSALMGIQRCMPGDSSQHVYVGRRSMLMESKWWHDLVTDTQSVFKNSIDKSNAYYFMRTRPVGWFGKGYKTLMNGDTSRLRSWVDAYKDSVHVYRWERTSPADTTLILREESSAQHLYDFFLMDTVEAGTTDTFCILAVTNRRTLPWLYNTSLPDSIEFMASYDFDTLSRHSRPDLRYKQIGARRIEIPFQYHLGGSSPYLLNIRSMIPRADSVWALDTTVSPTAHLSIDLRPGETRFLRIKCIRAADSIASGYLAYSTQNKLIAYPIAKSDSSGYTDSIRYHMVFHAREPKDSTRLNVWTVYYARSKPYHRSTVPGVDGIAWEPAIALSKKTYLSIIPTDNATGTRYNNHADSAGYYANLSSPVTALNDCSCGFPSIVVREVQANVPKVFVVYSCEDMWENSTARNEFFHVVENAFLDNSYIDTNVVAINGRSLVICRKNINHDGGTDTLKSLARFGTPVINASGDAKMYYAWSAYNVGIGAGIKTSTQPWFPAQAAITIVPTVTIMSGADTLAGGTAKYPSLNVYSNIAQQRTDATLVWQEGATHPHIRYTRLKPGAGSAIARSLPRFIEMSYDTSAPPSIPTDMVNNIAVVGAKESDALAELPVVVRSLQTDTMGMFIRDADGSPNTSFSYNHETVAWSEYITSQGRSRIRYNHFIDRTDTTPSQLHYWWTNTTYGSTASLFHPVLTNGLMKIDSLTWQGIVDDTLVTYDDSLHIIRGDVSDSSLVVNYCVLTPAQYDTMRVQRDAGNATYWTGLVQFPSIATQQIFLRRTPRPPSSSGLILHYNFLTASGAWPHLAMRMRENSPVGIPPIRRVLQYTNDSPPHLFASAEGFYKAPTFETPRDPVMRAGFDQQNTNVTVRAVLDDGTTISFHRYADSNLSTGYSGSVELVRQHQAIMSRTDVLVSDEFTVADVNEIDIISGGPLRQDIHLAVEECSSQLPSAAQLELADVNEAAPENEVHQRYYLTNGEQRCYRLKLFNAGTDPAVYREDLDIDPPAVNFSRAATSPGRAVDLHSMRSVNLSNASTLRVYPNPSHDVVSVIVDGIQTSESFGKNEHLQLEVVDAIGTVCMVAHVQRGEIVELRSLPTGTYVVAIRNEVGATSALISRGLFSVLR